DAILHEVASRLRNTLRSQDFVGRYGGEEFALVLVDVDIAEACTIAERLRMAIIAQPCFWLNEETQEVQTIHISGSIGVALYQLHGTTREELLESADQAMYRAKHTGRNRVCIADVTGVTAKDVLPSNIDMYKTSPDVAAVQALTAAASAHDQGTNEHAHRMVWFAEATARQLNRPDDEIRLLRLAALLHDIGKIGIPDTILHKPGPLTDEEWDIMRRHPQIGRKILEQAGGILQHLAHIVVAHHERWDGRGYPAGLSEEAIPMGARILSVVDSYDVMTSRRAYRKKTFSIEEARTELQRCAGTQYDPLVVEGFVAVLNAHLEEERQRLDETLAVEGTLLMEEAGR
ncbi:MAG: diguanylate cyclase, partial [Chloroflexota bacterium]|nr:diguanylate cyclase [Chloroflexota bacterium]